MSWFQRECSTTTGGPRTSEIDEELFFHLRSRIEDNRAAGMTEDEAWEDARRRLGSYRESVEECRSLSFTGGRRAAALAIAVLCMMAAGGWLMADWRAKGLAAQQMAMTNRLEVLTTAITQSAVAEKSGEDLEGLVTNKGKPVADADVLLILKTWPNNRYQQEPYHAKTGADGQFKFDKLLPAEGQFAVHAAVVGDGHTLTSAYHLFKAGNRELKAIKPLKLAVDQAQKLTFVLEDSSGKPLADARVAPASRTPGKGEEQIVYFAAAAPVTATSNAKGEVAFGCFARGDQGKLYVTLPGQPTTEVNFTVPAQGDVVKVVVSG